MKINDQKWGFVDFVWAFFPLRLVFAHLKYNLFLLLFWALLFLIVGDSLGYAFGVPLLFLSPEYLASVSPWSFFLVGFAIGGFTMAFNTYSYIKLGPHFPFLTRLTRPFFKFCINNSIIPIAFIVYYFISVYQFQMDQELASRTEVALYLSFCLLGIFGFFLIAIFYFFPVSYRHNKRLQKGESESNPISSTFHRPNDRWFDTYELERDRIYIYIGNWFKLQQSRSIKHLDRTVIEKTFAKNRINSSLFELITITSFFVLGFLNKHEFTEVPAAMSIVLLMTIILMIFSALRSWFRRWVYLLLIVMLMGMDYLSTKSDFFNYVNYAYGLAYDSPKDNSYSIARMDSISNNDSLNRTSFDSYIRTLENWKKQTGQKKPKLIIVNSSGGGSRSALWTLTVLQKCDELLDGMVSAHTQMITGASGGMVGAAYFRELILRKQLGTIDSPYGLEYRQNIGKDMLNRLSFMATTNDIFIRYQNFVYNDKKYTMDRGYAFEQQLHENTDNFLEHSLGYYKEYEQSGSIPTMIFSPTIINDGRRLLISSQQLNFLTEHHDGPSRMTHSNENIEFHSLLANQDANEIRFTSVLRTSATFPFVMPMVTIPTTPEIQLMDAGIRDNYGGKTTMEYLKVLNSWIKANTSGVIILQIRDTKKILDDESYKQVSFMDKITLPFGNMYANFPRVQDFDQEEMMKISAASFDFPIDLISFNLREKKEDRISLSWHLTKQEKIKIEKAFESKLNQHALTLLKRAL